MIRATAAAVGGPKSLDIGFISSSTVTSNAFNTQLWEDGAVDVEEAPTDLTLGYSNHNVTRIDENDHGGTPITAGYDVLIYNGDSSRPSPYTSMDNEHSSALPLMVNNTLHGLDTKLCSTNLHDGSDNDQEAVCLDATVIPWTDGHAVSAVVDWNPSQFVALYNYNTSQWDATDVVRLWSNQLSGGTIIGVLEEGEENNNTTNITARLAYYVNPIAIYPAQPDGRQVIEDVLQWLAGNI